MGLTISDADFKRIHEYMKENFGINLGAKRSLIEGRLSFPFSQSGFENFNDYIEDILTDKSRAKIDDLVIKLTTNYTYFMREEAHYRFLLEAALPEWAAKIRDKDLRVWSAGCSSGEEAYTIAMTIDEYFGFEKNDWDTTVLATDISSSVLEAAKKGIYKDDHLDKISPVRKRKYFEKIGTCEWRVRDELSREVIFSRFNLMDDFSKFRRKFHIIFCRNVMIYFDGATKTALARKFYNILEPGGYLFIGMSETLSGISDDFVQVQPSIYKR